MQAPIVLVGIGIEHLRVGVGDIGANGPHLVGNGRLDGRTERHGLIILTARQTRPARHNDGAQNQPHGPVAAGANQPS